MEGFEGAILFFFRGWPCCLYGNIVYFGFLDRLDWVLSSRVPTIKICFNWDFYCLILEANELKVFLLNW